MTSTARLNVGPRDPAAATAVIDPGGLAVGGPMAPLVARRMSLLTPADIGYLVGTAARAPSVANSQPWKFRVRGSAIELYADAARKLRYQDPAGRELMISCGAALFGLGLAFRKLGFVPHTELLPDAARPWLAARVEPVGYEPPTRTETELLAAVPHRHTHRGPFAPGEMSARLLAGLRIDAAALGTQLVLVDDDRQLAALAELVRAAAADQRSSAEVRAELGQWVLPPGSGRRDGVPASARLGLGCEPDEPGRLPPRDFGSPGSERCGDERRPAGRAVLTTAVLTTAGDTAADWLRAGQALHRILLHAATRWVFASLQSQPLEVPRRRAQLRSQLGLSGYPQIILQLGRANTAAATARRPHAELMTD